MALGKKANPAIIANPNPKPKQLTLKEKLEAILNDLDVSREKVLEDIEKVGKLKFKAGDFVIHKEYGNCIVVDHYIDLESFNLARKTDPWYSSPGITSQATPEIGYHVVGPRIQEIVPEEELLPFNSTTKVLYRKD